MGVFCQSINFIINNVFKYFINYTTVVWLVDFGQAFPGELIRVDEL